MQPDPKVFKERLREAISPENLRSWCETVGISYSTLNGSFQRNTFPNTELVAQISVLTARSIDWLLGLTDAEGAPLSRSLAALAANQVAIEKASAWVDFVQIPVYDVHASAGHGSFAPGEEEVDRFLAFRRDFIQHDLGITTNGLYCIKIKGVSMEPALHNRHPALVDPSDTEILEAGPHFIRLEGALLVKNLQRLPGGRLRIWSENQQTTAYQPIEMDWPPREGVDFKVFGRIRWSDCVF